jgi:hemolysin activation/secretion protein
MIANPKAALAGRPFRPRKLIGMLLSTLPLLLAGPLSAQTPAIPGQQGSQPLPELPAFPRQQQPPGFTLPTLPETLAPSEGPAARFLLKDVGFSGNQRFSDADLKALLAEYIGHPVNIAELEAMRLRLSRHYIEQGYLNSGARLPDQKISDGKVHFEIIEGRLVAIEIAGNQRLDPDYIRQRLRSPEDQLLDTRQLQERFQLLLSDPLIERLNGALRPAGPPGEAILDLQVERAEPYRLTLALDNHHSPASGSQRITADATLYNLSGLGDQLSLALDKSRGAWSGAGEFQLPLNAKETRLSFGFERNDSRIIENPLDIGNIESEYQGIALSLSHDLIRRLDNRVTLGVGYALRESRTWLDGQPTPFAPGVEADGITRTRILRLFQEYVGRTNNQVLSARSTFNIGLDQFNATVHEQLPDGRYLGWLGQFRYARKISDKGDLILLSGALQLSNDQLLPQERFAMGGASSLRGYRENSRVRDNGWFINLELRHPLLDDARWGNLAIAPFADIGNAWNHRAHDWDQTLSSIGIGLLWEYQKARAQLYLAKALKGVNQESEHNLQDDGIHLRLEVDMP